VRAISSAMFLFRRKSCRNRLLEEPGVVPSSSWSKADVPPSPHQEIMGCSFRSAVVGPMDPVSAPKNEKPEVLATSRPVYTC